MGFDQFGKAPPRSRPRRRGDRRARSLANEARALALSQSRWKLCASRTFSSRYAFFDAWRAERIRAAAQRQNQPLEADGARRHDFLAVALVNGGQRDGLLLGIQPRKLAHGEAEVIAPREHGVGQAFLMRIERARRDLMQRRLPDMKRKRRPTATRSPFWLLPSLRPSWAASFQTACTSTTITMS